MGSSCQSAARTLADVIARRPALEPVLRTFEPLLEARDGLVSRLAEEIRTTGFHLPAFQRERAVSGVPLMADMPVTGLAPAMRHAAEIMLPSAVRSAGGGSPCGGAGGVFSSISGRRKG